MAGRSKTVAQSRQYAVSDVASAKEIARRLMGEYDLSEAVSFGLPEVDDRYHIWRVPLLGTDSGGALGEVVIDAYTSLVIEDKSTARAVIVARLLHREPTPRSRKRKETYRPSQLRNTVAHGDAEDVLASAPSDAVDLIFTSPPYYNARVEYSDYVSYADYLLKLRKIIQAAHRVLGEGRFFVMNTAPVLVRRTSRSEASRRIAVPFDLHGIFIEEGYEFIDDIIWVKPEGAGWATGRGRRFAADRNPMQYKAVPVTEYLLVYRKKTDKLIDWHIRNMASEVVADSKIEDGYERTNIWKIHPANHPAHPAVFPIDLAKKVITYYSFKNDVVLDPFAGTGTVGKAAVELGRRFFLIEKDRKYLDMIRTDVTAWLGKHADQVLWQNCPPADTRGQLF